MTVHKAMHTCCIIKMYYTRNGGECTLTDSTSRTTVRTDKTGRPKRFTVTTGMK